MKPTIIILALLLSSCAAQRIATGPTAPGGIFDLIRGNAEDAPTPAKADVNLNIDIYIYSGKPAGATITTE